MSKDPLSPFTRARMRGMNAAAREHSFLKIDLSQRVDIFALLEHLHVWIMFQPLDALYGAYMNEGKAVFINVKHPPSLQRFTAAHEYGHTILQHAMSCDLEENILPSHRVSTMQEVEAQTFAANFLMPAELVNRTLKHMELASKLENMSEHDVYQLSLRLGASYLAVVNHLVSLKKIDSHVAQTLRRKQPRDIKNKLRQLSQLTNSWADVWMIDERDHNQQIVTGPGDEVHLYLPENEYIRNLQIEPVNGNRSVLTLTSVNMEMAIHRESQEKQQLVHGWHFVLQVEDPGEADVYVESKQGASPAFKLRVRALARYTPGIIESQQYYL